MISNAPTAWSYSALSMWEECPARYKYTKIDKLPDPPGPAMLRGREMHKEIENYLKSPKRGEPVPYSGQKFTPLLEAMKDAPNLLVEQQWAFNKRWGEARWFKDPTTWLRAVVDAGVIYDDNVVEIIDWKSGKLYSENTEQVELFALSAMVRYTQAPMVITRLSYLDSGEELIAEHKATDREKLKLKWEGKAARLFADTLFAPKPSTKACKFCPFSRSKGGPCREG